MGPLQEKVRSQLRANMHISSEEGVDGSKSSMICNVLEFQSSVGFAVLETAICHRTALLSGSPTVSTSYDTTHHTAVPRTLAARAVTAQTTSSPQTTSTQPLSDQLHERDLQRSSEH